MGVEASVAHDGAQALQLAANGKSPDLVFLDIGFVLAWQPRPLLASSRAAGAGCVALEDKDHD